MSAGERHLRVLIVDASRDVPDVTRRWLAAHPLVGSVRCTASVREAVDAAAAGEVDLLLVDAGLPGIGGFEATRRIKALPCPPLVVLLVLFDYAAVRAEAERAGADACIDKPALMRQLPPMLRSFASRARPSASTPGPVDPA